MEKFFEKYHEALYNCTKPYQYVGGEFLSENKDFDSAKVRVALCFPDKYEIGISNLGLRVLYGLINGREEYMCDRAYAPEPDFKPEILYGLESKRPVKDFDVVGFSLQYEMAYPTALKMLEMAGIPYRNDMRDDNDPIIIAGGPCTFNPLPMADFIDVFIVGDGEDAIIEICEIIEKTKGQPRAERIKALCENENSGCWSKLTGGKVKKRIAQLTYDTALKKYPIPFSSSVQDRAVVEIRRGCGRMCRFCQPGHVTLPIRERESEEIIRIAKELVQNTGYDEYSLLSLSSNDYANINETIKELSIDFNKKKVSVSLPSQRIDGFNLELANLVQSVRKSTMTLAPEAGSQRLRDVIKKNITEDMIIDAVTTLYENGWSRVKFYFICGLPTETLRDMDEMAELFRKIRYRCRGIKMEKGLKHGMDITCTLSIFVPKPFTPFQWCPQMPLDKVTEHIKYLKEQIKNIKGVKINYHEQTISQIEAVLTRGDSSLCDYIEALYKKGCYLDAWGEYFKEDIWHDTAKELNIDLTALAQKEYSREDVLPWDFVDVGLNKEWLVKEYNDAFKPENLPDAECSNDVHIIPTCQTSCVNCGVCQNFKVKKVMAKPFKASDKYKPEPYKDPTDGDQSSQKPVYKYRIKLTKTGILRYFSHLDWQNTFFKAISRTDLKVAFSQGFNPTMKISMGIALPLFAQSECEFTDIELWENPKPDEIKSKLEQVLPKECKILSIEEKERSAPAIEMTAQWAEYKICIFNKGLYDFENLKYNTNRVLSSEEIFIEKKNKKGLIKKINIKPAIKSYRFEKECLFIVLKTGQGTEIPALRADVLMSIIEPEVTFDITRTRFFDEELREL
ncbi:TIGR03936 family radical SAM-associated protein [bacterium]|nr:TIGR03936 family radical SAM-associated protein [bacterium]